MGPAVGRPVAHSDRLPKAARSHAARELLAARLRTGSAWAIPRRPASPDSPLSFAQERLWFLQQLEPASPLYNRPAAFRAVGPLEVAALSRALDEVLRRHDVLRAIFPTIDGQPRQEIATPAPLTLPLVDLSSLPVDAREAEARRLAVEEARRPFDLARGPLVRAVLYRLGLAEHILLVATHHIAFDAWSAQVLKQELGALYAAFARGQPSPLAELPIQYGDYAAWQRERLQGEALAEQLAYWKGRLAGPLPVLELPTDRPHPAAQSYAGGRCFLHLGADVATGLQALGREENATLFMLLLAAYGTLLHRYSAQDDILVGVPVAGRGQVETEDLLGCFVNTLVLRVDLAGDPTTRELLARVREVALGAFAHQDLPFERLVHELQPERRVDRSPLVQVMLNLRNVQRPAAPLALSWQEWPLGPGLAEMDLSLEVAPASEGLDCALVYRADLFDSATVERMLGHWQMLLEGIVANPDRRLSELPLLTRGEQAQLATWNDTRRDWPMDRCLHQLLEEQVRRTPDAVAAIYEDEQLTCAELNARANRLAHCLIARGVAPDTLVGLHVQRSLDMLVGFFGILKAGGAYLPLDPSYPRDRLAFMLEDSRASLVVTQEHLRGGLPAQGVRAICLDADWPAIARESAEDPCAPTQPGHLAYVIYTSGSTGRPKGVMIEHRSAANLVRAVWETVGTPQPGQAPRATLNAPLSFDVSVQQLALLMGGYALAILPQDVRLDPAATLAYLARHQVDLLDGTPTQLAPLVEAGLLEPGHRYPRTILSGGEAVPTALWEALARADHVTSYNLYGPTECTVDAIACRIAPTLAGPAIGHPLANYEAYVLDGHLQPVPIGVPGELYIGGVGLARGYWHRTELTAERFIANPFRPGTRLYRTGDRARFLADGNIEYLGRLDEQVKIRGFRVEPGEVEAALARHPGVRQAAVAAREDTPGDRRLVAYVVPEGDPPREAALRAFLQGRLPDYMVPSAFVVLDALPLAPGGKVDRRALPAPEPSASGFAGYVAPRNAIEERVAALWAELLGLERVGVHDDFFTLGGHSLLAMRAVARLDGAFGVEIPVSVLFRAPTVEGLALAIVRALAAQVEATSIALPAEDGPGPGDAGDAFPAEMDGRGSRDG